MLDLHQSVIDTEAGLLTRLCTLPNHRKPKGVRHKLASILLVRMAAMLCDNRSPTDIAELQPGRAGLLRSALRPGATSARDREVPCDQCDQPCSSDQCRKSSPDRSPEGRPLPTASYVHRQWCDCTDSPASRVMDCRRGTLLGPLRRPAGPAAQSRDGRTSDSRRSPLAGGEPWRRTRSKGCQPLRPPGPTQGSHRLDSMP